MTVSRIASRRQLVLALAAALAVAGCATPSTVTSAPGSGTVPSGTGVGVELGSAPAAGDVAVTSAPVAGGDAGSAMTAWDPVVIDASVPVGPENECAGVDQTATDFTRLTADDQVSEIVVCGSGVGYLPGDGTWNLVSEHQVPAAQVPTLVDGLRRPDVMAPPDTACTMILVMVPTFTVVTTDGRRVKGSVPSDGCHPQEDVVGLLDQVVEQQPTQQRWRTNRIQTETALTGSCTPDKTVAVSWPPPTAVDGAAPSPGPIQVPPDGAVDGAEICLYPAPGTAADVPSTVIPIEPSAEGDQSPAGASGAVEVAPVAPRVPPSAGGGSSASPPSTGALLLGTGRIDAALRDRLVASVVPSMPADRPACSTGDAWTTAADGSGQLVLATPPTRTPAGVPQPGYPYLVVETGSCARVLVDGGYTFAGWADPQVVAEVRAAIGG